MATKVIGHLFQVLGDSSQELSIDSRPRQAIIFDQNGVIQEVSPSADAVEVEHTFDFGNSFIIPGFIDSHVHYPQIDMIGVYSGELLEWLR